MMEFGKSLRLAREAKGYSVAQLAETTRLAPSVVENLENGNFDCIAAPIYGRGFVKLYCEAVGLEPKPFVNEFMEIVNGNHEASIRERAAVRPAADAPVAEAPVAEAPVEEKEPAAVTESERAAETEPPLDAADLFHSEPADAAPTFSRYSAPFHTIRASSLTSLWRIAALVLAAGALLVLVLFGLRLLYRATAETKATESADVKPAASQAAKPAVPRTPQKIPALYFDN